MMDRFDKDGNGSISYEEFLQEAEGFMMLCSENRLENCFKMFDMNEDGDIEMKEVQQVLTGGIKQISHEEWEQILKKFDADADGKLNYTEFKRLMIHAHAHQNDGNDNAKDLLCF